jgi:hypothetical protein
VNPHQVNELGKRGITQAEAIARGVLSIDTEDQLPPECPAYWTRENGYLPGLLFPWTAVDGRVEYQLRPDVPPLDKTGRAVKYVARSREAGYEPVLWVAKRGTDMGMRLIVEGTCQTLAAAIYAPPGTWVLGMFGCRGWMDEGSPVLDLSLVDDAEVVIALDADMHTNRDVWDAGEALQRAVLLDGASRVSFMKLAGKKTGLDDVLGREPEDRRAMKLVRLIEQAGREKFPTSRRPKPTKKKAEGETRDTGGRPVIAVNGDRLHVIDDLTSALQERWDGRELFNFGGALTRVEGHTATPLEEGEFLDALARTVVTVNRAETAEGEVKETHGWPDQNVVKSVASRGKHFTELAQIQRAPFVRADGTVVTEPGYDPTSKTLLALPEGLEVNVATDPSPDGVAKAVEFLQEEWLGDFPFPTEEDRANALALAMTPLVRGLFDLAPVAVVNGLQMGVGKNKFANVVSIVATGETSSPLGYNRDGEEMRKLITSVFRTGATLMVLDECHHLEGEHLARTITSPNYQDRVLGGSVMARFPNRATWMTLGNNVRVEGDMMRRVYQVAMRTDQPNPQDRPSSSFRHPDIEGWTQENRGKILAAMLTLVSAWHQAGRPGPPGGTSFGSFEGWERVLGGVFAVTGVKGFLGNMKEFRSDSDYSVALWTDHVSGLWEHFGGKAFMTKDVVRWLQTNRDTAEPPPGPVDLSDPGYARNLGMAYQRHRDRWYGGYRLTRLEGTGIGKVAKWTVQLHPGVGTENIPIQPVGAEGGVGVPPPYNVKKNKNELSNDTVTDHENKNIFSLLGAEGTPAPTSTPVEDPWHVPVTVDPTPPPAKRQVNPFVDYPDPLDAVYALARPDLDLRCPDCDRPREPVPPASNGYACRVCQASMF